MCLVYEETNLHSDQQGPPYYQSGTVRCDEKNPSFCNIQEF